MGGIKLWRVSLACVAVLLAAGGLVALAIPKEPRYQGRTLSQWLEFGSRGNPYCYVLGVVRNTSTDPRRAEVRRAVRAIGTNGIPYYVKWSCARDSKTKTTAIDWLNARLAPRFHFWSARERQAAAYIGFAMLGEQAKPAWPLLAQWSFDKDPDRRKLGLDSLINTQADEATLIPVFERILKGNDNALRDELQFHFAFYYRDDAAAEHIFSRLAQLKQPPQIRERNPPALNLLAQ